MAVPDLVCVLEGSGALIFRANSCDHSLSVSDLFDHTVGGVTTRYKVETALLDVVSTQGDPHAANKSTNVVQRVTASIIP